MANRVLKFRAWDSINGRMIYDFFYLDSDGDVWYDQDPHGVQMSGNKSIKATDKLTVMSYTGLKDKAGNEIYEFDIITDYNGNKRMIEFIDGGFWCVYPKGDKFLPSENTREIIGNIFQNPELLTI